MSFLTQHIAAARSALRRLAASPLNTLLSLLVIGTALALPAGGWILLDNVQRFGGDLSGVQQISIFMTTDTSKKSVADIESRLREAKPGKWRMVTREDALKRLKETEGMADLVAGLGKNPLPDAFIVEPDDSHPEAMERLAETFKSWPGVAHVQLDSAWSRRLDTFLHIARLAVALLAGLFAGALVAATFNTIRLQILAQGAEIEVSRLIGATDAFIRRPFQYFGAVQGILGALFSLLLIAGTGTFLAAPIAELLALYGANFVPSGLSLPLAGILASIGGVLGWLGAQISVAIHLRRIG